MTDVRSVSTVVDEVIREVAGIAVEPDGSFFEAGLTSALLVEIHARLEDRLGRAIPVTDLFKYPSRRALAGHLAGPAAAAPVSAARDRPLSTADRRELRARLRHQGSGC
jgi:acyl carrier protein